MNRKPSFTLNEFKNWLSNQSNSDEILDFNHRAESSVNEDIVGCEVHAKVSSRKLLEKIVSDSSDPESLVEDLVENGGVAISVSGKHLVVEVDSGTFRIPRFCVRLVKPD